jgi:hypothetical protein
VASIAILDMVSRRWLATFTSAEETSTQIEVAFTAALESEGLLDVADQRAALRTALASGDRAKANALADQGQVPLLLAVSHSGPQMRNLNRSEQNVQLRCTHEPLPAALGPAPS